MKKYKTEPNPLPPAEDLRLALRYVKSSGKIYWRTRDKSAFSYSTSCRSIEWLAKNWNSLWAGKEAYTSTLKNGYKSGSFNGRKYYAHRVIWKMVYGEDPRWVDHVNGDRSDNRITNLRSVGISENGKNATLQRRNISGQPGVLWDRVRSKWSVRITSNWRVFQLGRYKDLDEAIHVRKKAEKTYGFHKNHGKPKR
jgi:hypothetical protein